MMKYINWQTKILLLIVVIQSCIQLKDSVIDENEFLGNKTNPLNIYENPGDGTFINPFNINTDNWGLGNIKKLMLVEFEELHGYCSVELQVAEKDGVEGGLVIVYYANKKQADVYHTPNLFLSKKMYTNILNNAVITETPIQYRFEEKRGLLKASLHFTDRFKNEINMVVDEQLGDMKPCGLLAPIGGEAMDPEFMAIVFMKHFKFLSQNEKEIQVDINGKKAKLIKLPVKANGVKGYQTKYSMEPVTVSWNKNDDTKLKKLRVNKNNLYQKEDSEILCLNNGGHLEIKRFSGIQNRHKVNFRFSPAIPDLQQLKNARTIEGRFSVSVDETTGIIAGEYIIQKQREIIVITIQPTKGYSPVPGKPWMKKMTWKATVSNDTKGDFILKSVWVKNN